MTPGTAVTTVPSQHTTGMLMHSATFILIDIAYQYLGKFIHGKADTYTLHSNKKLAVH
jgi:hypothetical protein